MPTAPKIPDGAGSGGRGSNCACTLTPGTTNVLISAPCLLGCYGSIQENRLRCLFLPSAVSKLRRACHTGPEQIPNSSLFWCADTVVPIRGNAPQNQRETQRPYNGSRSNWCIAREADELLFRPPGFL